MFHFYCKSVCAGRKQPVCMQSTSVFRFENYLCLLLLLLQKEKKSLLKLLSSNKKKSRPSPPSSPTLEGEQAAAGEVLQGAVGPDTSPPAGSVSCLEPEPAAAAAAVTSSASSSCSSSAPEPSHRKSSPLDGCAPIAPPPRQPCSSLLSQQHDVRPIICERYNDFCYIAWLLCVLQVS